MSSSRLQFANKINWSGVASPAWNTACSVFCWSELESSAKRSVIFSTPSLDSISCKILLFSLIRYLNTVSRRDMLWCWHKFLKLDRFSRRATELLYLTQMSIKLFYTMACLVNLWILPLIFQAWDCCSCFGGSGVPSGAAQELAPSCLQRKTAQLVSELPQE